MCKRESVSHGAMKATSIHHASLCSNTIGMMGFLVIATGWPSLIGCLKLQVIFSENATNHRALLWKMTYKDKASFDSTPPCIRLVLVSR